MKVVRQTKKCTGKNSCGLIKNISEFYIRTNGYINSQCEECIKKFNAEHREERKIYNKQYRKVHREELLIKKKEYYEENKEDLLLKNKEYRTEKKEEISLQRKNYREEHKEEINTYHNEYEKNRRKNDPVFKLRKYISTSIGIMLKSNGSSKAGQSILNYLPYTIDQLKLYLKSKFEPWMNWENYGTVEGYDQNNPATWKWQLDHIIPHSDFDYQTMNCQEFQDCWALNNLRPYSAKQNQHDGATKIRHKVD